MRIAIVALLALTACCSRRPAESVAQEQARLRLSLQKYYAEYTAAIETENSLVAETLGWLNGNAISAPRTQAVAEARNLMQRWGRVYFVPRVMHGDLRFHEYSSPEVKAVQARMLDRLKERYFELHDYQRYAQYASESEMHRTASGRLPKQLEEFRARLQAKPRAVDEIGPLLREL